MPYGQKSTLYDALGLSRDAPPGDIQRTYRRLAAELKTEGVAPDPRREALIHEAYEVLSDAQRRAAYDKSLLKDAFLGKAGGAAPARKWGLMAAFVALFSLGAWYFFVEDKSATGVKPAAGSLQEIQTAASVAVGRVNRIEISGSRSGLGAAVAIEEGVMMAPCQGIGPGAQILVRMPPRDIPAQVRQADEAAGLCRLAVSGAASWPLPRTASLPKVGDTVYAANLDPLGQVVVVAGEVRKVTRAEAGTVIESTARVATPVEGTPLLDSQGRIVALWRGGLHVALPAGWAQ